MAGVVAGGIDDPLVLTAGVGDGQDLRTAPARDAFDQFSTEVGRVREPDPAVTTDR
ncbi:hypothetical protein BH10ACT10_BH10ACT10_05200 [soil metagenome]